MSWTDDRGSSKKKKTGWTDDRDFSPAGATDLFSDEALSNSITNNPSVSQDEKPSFWSSLASSAGRWVGSQASFVAKNPVQAAKNVGGALVDSEKKFAGSISDGIAANMFTKQNEEQQIRKQELDQKILDIARNEKDPEKKKKLLSQIDLQNTGQIDTFKEADSLNKSNTQVFAEAGGVALDIATAGAVGEVGTQVSKFTAKRLAKAVLFDSGIGALQGADEKLKEGSTDIKEILKSAAIGAGIGGALPIAGKGLSTSIGKLAKLRGITGEITNEVADDFEKFIVREVNMEQEIAGKAGSALSDEEAIGKVLVKEQLNAREGARADYKKKTRQLQNGGSSKEEVAAAKERMKTIESEYDSMVNNVDLSEGKMVKYTNEKTGKTFDVMTTAESKAGDRLTVVMPAGDKQSVLKTRLSVLEDAAELADSHLNEKYQPTEEQSKIFERFSNIETATAPDEAFLNSPKSTISSPQELTETLNDLDTSKIDIVGTKPLANNEIGIVLHDKVSGETTSHRIVKSESYTEVAPTVTGEVPGSSTDSKTGIRQYGTKFGVEDVYEKESLKAKQELSDSFYKENPDLAKDVIQGKAEAPEGLKKIDILEAVRRNGESDPALIEELVNTGAVSEESAKRTEIARELGSVRGDGENALDITQKVQDDRINSKHKDRESYKKKEKTEQEILDQKIKAEKNSQEDLDEYIKNLPVNEGNQKLLTDLREGTLKIDDLMSMKSEGRQKAFEKYFTEENARRANVLFEKKLMLKNQINGMLSWIKESGLPKARKTDLETTVKNLGEALTPESAEKMKKALIAQRLGVSVSKDEIETIAKYSEIMKEAKKGYNPIDGSFESPEQLENWSQAKAALTVYTSDLKEEASSALSAENFKKNPAKFLLQQSGLGRALQATLDNSFWGRQGSKAFFTQPKQWAENFANSFGIIAKTVSAKSDNGLLSNEGIDSAVRIQSLANHYARENYRNGTYDLMRINRGVEKGGYGSSLATRIPGAGRLIKAADAAYDLGSMKLKDDIADAWIISAKGKGKDVTSKEWLKEQGSILNTLTGRDSSGGGEDFLSLALYSKNFFKSNFNFLTSSLFDSSVTKEGKIQAAKQLATVSGGIYATMQLADSLPGVEVEDDMRSSNFGQARIGDKKIDLTGGLRTYITLAARIIPTTHDGEWGQWSKSSGTGSFTRLNERDEDGNLVYGGQSSTDLLFNFFQGKGSPAISFATSILNQSNYDGSPVTLKSSMQNLAVPLVIQNAIELQEEPNKALAAFLITSDLLGWGVSNTNRGTDAAGDKGTKSRIANYLRTGDESSARKELMSIPVEERAEVWGSSYEKAGQQQDREKNQKLDFYDTYGKVKTERARVKKEVKSLIRDGKGVAAQRKAEEFNGTILDNFKSHYSSYGEFTPEAEELLNKIPITL